MRSTQKRILGITGVVFLFIAVTATIANAHALCVLHPGGDIVPCTHLLATPWGYVPAHPAGDIVPCTHFVPCF
jgi:hypothetical protein